MEQINIHEVRSNLSRLVTKAAMGEPFIITRFGKPIVTVGPYVRDVTPIQRVGFLKGKIKVPDDFDAMGRDVIEHLFEDVE